MTPWTLGGPTEAFREGRILVSVATLVGFEPTISTLKGRVEPPSATDYRRTNFLRRRASSLIQYDFRL